MWVLAPEPVGRLPVQCHMLLLVRWPEFLHIQVSSPSFLVKLHSDFIFFFPS